MKIAYEAKGNKMIKLKKNIYKFIFFIIIALNLLIITVAVHKKDYSTLIRVLSALTGCGFYLAIDLKVIEPLRKRIVKQDLFNAILWIVSIIIIITNFILFIIINNRFVSSAFHGFIFPSVYFAVKYWNEWMEDDVSNS